jgi:hypothetical protein
MPVGSTWYTITPGNVRVKTSRMWSDKDNHLATKVRAWRMLLSAAFPHWKVLHRLFRSGYCNAPFPSLAKHIKSRDAMSGQSKMDRNNPRRRFVTLYCSQGTQTQPESKYEEAESSDFGTTNLNVLNIIHRKVTLHTFFRQPG